MIIPLRLSIFVMMLVAIHLNTSIKHKDQQKGQHAHNRILTLLLLTYLLHNSLLIPIWIISRETLLYIDLALPFGLMYGPLFLFYYMSIINQEISRVRIIANITPILISWVLYFIFIFNENIRIHTAAYYYPVLYGCVGISLISYSIYILRKEYKKSKNQIFSYFSFYFILVGIFMMYLSFQVLSKTFDDGGTQDSSSNLIVTLVMISGGLLLLDFVFRLFRSQFQSQTRNYQDVFYSLNYQEGAKTVENHITSIESFFTSEHVADNTMDLKKAASILEISQSKLQSCIQQEFGVSFSKILTIKRVEYAGNLIVENDYSELPDNLFEMCGFNSKSTFYRNFTNIMGNSPLRYKDSLLKT